MGGCARRAEPLGRGLETSENLRDNNARAEGYSMERAEVKMYSDYKSPFAYLAFDPAFALQERFAMLVRWIPFQLRIKDRGQRSVYSDYKARYSYLDARRWAKPRGILIRGPLKIYDSRPALIGGLFANEH